MVHRNLGLDANLTAGTSIFKGKNIGQAETVGQGRSWYTSILGLL